MAYGKADKAGSQKTRLAIGIYNFYILHQGVRITMGLTLEKCMMLFYAGLFFVNKNTPFGIYSV